MGLTEAAPGGREHGWDALRAFLMLLGIPYHTAIAYQPGHEWIVRSGEGEAVFTYLAEFIHLFRMPAFFVIAGYFAALLLARRAPGLWLKQRFMRLGLPFLTGLVLLVPIMNLVCELSNLPFDEALRSWHENSLTSGGYWVRHLWFIIILLYCSIAAAALAWRFPALRAAVLPERIDAMLARHMPFVVASLALALGAWQAGAIEAFYAVGLATNVGQQILRIDEVIAFAPFFALGCVMARAPLLRARLARFSPSVALLALAASLTALIMLNASGPATWRFVTTIAAVAITQCLIAGAIRFASRPSPMVQQLAAASLVIYLFHLPIIVVLVALGQHVAVPVVVKAPAVMTLSLLLSFGAWRVIERSDLLSFFFDGRKPAGTRAAPRPA